MLKTSVALALGLIALPTLAHAEAFTYQGTIGDKKIVVEFSEKPTASNADIYARYFYMDQGADIPLHAAPANRASFGLVEEVACSEEKKNCPHSNDDPPKDPPLGAKWQLTVADDGKTIDGEFSLNGRNRPVKLELVGSREFDPAGGVMTMTDFASGLFWQGTTLTAETSPYDYLKMTGITLKQSDTTETNGTTYRYVTDPRTKFQFPRVVGLGGGDIAAANATLEQRHWMMSLDALWCVAQQYQGFGWNGYNYSAGSLGWYDEEMVTMSYLSPTLMSWTEGGSLSCGGAHPYNHFEYHNVDTATGKPLDLGQIFKGWVAKDFDGNIVDQDDAKTHPNDFHWGGDEELSAFVKSHRPSDEELGLNPDSECPMDELIDTNLAIGFKDADTVIFTLGDLPYVIQACASDLYEAPIGDLKDLLAPGAATYFPSLKS